MAQCNAIGEDRHGRARGRVDTGFAVYSRRRRIDRLMVDLLQTHDGIFLGEIHDQPALVQSVTHLLPLLKASGVGTLSMELPQGIVDAVHSNQTYDDYRTAGGLACLKRLTLRSSKPREDLAFES